ncbi:glycosyltransferase family 4 protein [Winogradskyella wichelsiae]|uniref:glycosyltransferase family 4 protein n=1 Tax=Winogradskyella wichelsiae TaxID=2697007 RepID=UPI003EF934AB
MKTNILISYIGLPTQNIGSWSIMFSKLIASKPSLFTHIICPESDDDQSNLKYKIVKPPLINSFKFQKVFKYYRFKNYYKVLKRIINKNENITINIIDNINLLLSIHELLVRDNLRDKVSIIYHLHGYDLYINDKALVYNAADKLLVLTEKTYEIQNEAKLNISCVIKQIYNGIDLNLFYPVGINEQNQIKKELNLKQGLTYYLWISQDRKKKGLHVVLEAWAIFIKSKPNVRLLVIGTDKDKYSGVQVAFLGRILNDQLPKYYQIATFFLFSTLCNEGHPLALTEALVSGCYCLASKIDPIPEIMNNGEYGLLVNMPEEPKSWVASLNASYVDYEEKGNQYINPKIKYSLQNWMNSIENLMQEKD